MTRRRWTYVGLAAGAFGAIAGIHWVRKKRAANASSKQFPGMWDLTKDVSESIESGKRALRGEEGEEEESDAKPPVD
ncbi:MAG: hypothetical protein M3O84_05600 [Actinomycetota bacterium]|jgi:hypothetical protein|nr:hypothetical protein [Actinomycetota bacterium]